MSIYLITRNGEVIGYVTDLLTANCVVLKLESQALQFTNNLGRWLHHNPEPNLGLSMWHDGTAEKWELWNDRYKDAIAYFSMDLEDKWPEEFRIKAPAYAYRELDSLKILDSSYD